MFSTSSKSIQNHRDVIDFDLISHFWQNTTSSFILSQLRFLSFSFHISCQFAQSIHHHSSSHFHFPSHKLYKALKNRPEFKAVPWKAILGDSSKQHSHSTAFHTFFTDIRSKRCSSLLNLTTTLGPLVTNSYEFMELVSSTVVSHGAISDGSLVMPALESMAELQFVIKRKSHINS